MGIFDDVVKGSPTAPSGKSVFADVVNAPDSGSSIVAETLKAPARVIGGIAQEAGEAAQYVTGDRVGKGIRQWGEEVQQRNAQTPEFREAHPILSTAGDVAEGVAKMAPYLAADAALSVVAPEAGIPAAVGLAARGIRAIKAAPMATAVLPAVAGAAQGQRSYEKGVANGLTPDEALTASLAPAASTGVGLAAMGALSHAAQSLGGAAKTLPKAFAKHAAADTGIMMGQGVATSAAEKASGIDPDVKPLDQLKDPKAWLNAALTGGLFAGMGVAKKALVAKALKTHTDAIPDLPPEEQRAAVAELAAQIHPEDVEARSQTQAEIMDRLDAGDHPLPEDVIAHLEEASKEEATPEAAKADIVEALKASVASGGELNPMEAHEAKVEQTVQEDLAPAEPETGIPVTPAPDPAKLRAEAWAAKGDTVTKAGVSPDAEVAAHLDDMGYELVNAGRADRTEGGNVARDKWVVRKKALTDDFGSAVLKRPGDSITLYHGGSTDSHESILKEGIRPNKLHGLGLAEPDQARLWAQSDATTRGAKDPVIYKVNIPKSEFTRIQKDHASNDHPDWRSYNADLRSGNIKPEWISEVKVGRGEWEPAHKPAPELPTQATLNGITAEITPEQAAKFAEIDKGLAERKEMIERQKLTGLSEEDAQKALKGAAMRAAAEKRKAAPQFATGKEQKAAAKKAESNFIGKEVSHEGRAAEVVGSPFGKVKIKYLDDGSTKAVSKEELLPREKAGPVPLKEGEQRLAYDDNPNLVIGRKEGRIGIVDAKNKVALGVAHVKDGKFGGWMEGKEPASPEERVQMEAVIRRHLGEATAKFNQGEGVGIPKADIEAHLKGIITKLKVPVEVVDDASGVPGLTTAVKFNGAFHQGKIYLNAEHLSSVHEAERVLLRHELAHAGLLGSLGKEGLNRILGKAWGDLNSGVREFAKLKGIDTKDKAGKLEATEEYLVHLAETDAKHPLWDKFVAAIKAVMRKAGFDMKYTDAELRSLVVGATRSMTTGEGETRFSTVKPKAEDTKITDPGLINELESGEKIKVFRAMQIIDGKLYPPMSASIGGGLRPPTEIGVWEKAAEQPHLADDKGFFKLEKGNKKTIKARYNPYFHTSYSPLNDQFSEAYNRPNLVTVEAEVPASELTSGYKAENAKDAVGEMSWHSGPVSSKLPAEKARRVILSRYAKVLRVVPDSEVADHIAGLLSGEKISVPENVVTPALKDELVKRGVDVTPLAKSATLSNDSIAKFNRVADDPRAGEAAADEVGARTGLQIAKRALSDIVGTAWRAIMPVDRTIKMAQSLKEYAPIKDHLEAYVRLKRSKAAAADEPTTQAQYIRQDFEKAFKTDAAHKAFDELTLKASLYELHADPRKGVPWTERTWNEQKRGQGGVPDISLGEAKTQVAALWGRLSPEQQEVQQRIIEHMASMADKFREAQLEPLRATFGDELYAQAEGVSTGLWKLDAEGVAALRESVGDDVMDLAQQIAEINSDRGHLKGDYAPLMRFGEHLVRTHELVDGELGDRISMQAFESKQKALDEITKINAQPGKAAQYDLQTEANAKVANVPLAFIEKLRAAAEARGITGEALDALVDDFQAARASTLPRMSMAGHKLRREGVEGYSTDALRSYATYIAKSSRSISQLKYGTQIEQTFRDMGNSIKAYQDPNGEWDPHAVERMSRLKDNLYKLEKTGDQEKINEFTKNVGKMTFLWYLSSPSVWAVQWSQPFMTTIPKMAARYGFGKSFSAYVKEAKEFTSGKFSDEKIEAFNRAHENVGQRMLALIEQERKASPAERVALRGAMRSLYDSFSPAEQKLLILKTLSLQGMLDLSASHALHDLITGATDGQKLVDHVVTKGAYFMQKSETGSRRAAAISSFQLALAHGKDFMEANDYASNIIDDTLADFSSQNRPQLLRGNVGRVVGQFQFFRTHMLGKTVQLAKDAMGEQGWGENRKELAYMTGMSMALAGAGGTPIAMLVSNTATDALWDALSFMFGDPDDPWDPKQDFQNALKEAVGEDASNVFLKGLPSMLGVDISKRVGLGGMSDVIQGDPPPGLTGTQRANWYAGRILGPAYGMVSDSMRAIDAVNNGEYGQAAAVSSPKVVKDFIKAYGMNEKGVTTAGGKTLVQPEDVSPWSVALQLVGINPSEVSLAQEENRAIANLSTEMRQRRSLLIKRVTEAQMAGDMDAREEALQGISTWGEKQPALKITHQELANAVKRGLDARAGKLSKKDLLMKEKLEGGV